MNGNFDQAKKEIEKYKNSNLQEIMDTRESAGFWGKNDINTTALYICAELGGPQQLKIVDLVCIIMPSPL